jgi:6-phosphogluconate dehydrogenase
MQMGFVGLGKMGANMVHRVHRDSANEMVVFDFSKDAVDEAVAHGATPASSLEEMVAKLSAPRAVWIMVPSGDPTEETVEKLLGLLEAGDMIVDGGNSKWTDSKRRAAHCSEQGVEFVDVGTSGGVWGLKVGYCMMVGGSDGAVARVKPILDVLAPPDGWGHMGPSGSGHYVKMVHNGIEYGVMQAYAEGFEVLHASEYELDNAQIANLWNHASVIRSWLCELAALAFEADGNDLANIEGWVADSGEGRWTIADAIDHDVPTPAITAALYARLYSRSNGDYTARVLAALRNQFGGHAVKSAAG